MTRIFRYNSPSFNALLGQKKPICMHDRLWIFYASFHAAYGVSMTGLAFRAETVASYQITCLFKMLSECIRHGYHRDSSEGTARSPHRDVEMEDCWDDGIPDIQKRNN